MQKFVILFLIALYLIVDNIILILQLKILKLTCSTKPLSKSSDNFGKKLDYVVYIDL